MGVKAVDEDQEIMLITTEGIIIRLEVNNISKLGRVTSGVKLINMDDNITVASIARVRECENEIEKDIFTLGFSPRNYNKRNKPIYKLQTDKNKNKNKNKK